MNRLKSFFISALTTVSIIIIVWAVFRLVQDGISVGWVGTALTALPIALYLANLYRFTTARTSRNLTGMVAVVAVGVLLAAVGTVTDTQQGGVALFLAVGMMLGTLLYVFWYSRLERALNQTLVAGQKLPTVSFMDVTGTAVSPADLAGEKALYLFYRGNWCPLCMAQIREVAAQYRELAQRGVRVVLISPQPQSHTARLADRFEVPMLFWVDTDNRAARRLGIAHEHGVPAGFEVLGYKSETVLPTVLLVGEDGRILYSSQTDNYRVRPEPAEFLRVLDALA